MQSGHTTFFMLTCDLQCSVSCVTILSIPLLWPHGELKCPQDADFTTFPEVVNHLGTLCLLFYEVLRTRIF